jgi:hypothetical protein
MNRFALSFDCGYYWGEVDSFEVADRALENFHWGFENCIPLIELRTALFVEQRRAAHADGVDIDLFYERMGPLIEAIRRRVVAQSGAGSAGAREKAPANKQSLHAGRLRCCSDGLVEVASIGGKVPYRMLETFCGIDHFSEPRALAYLLGEIAETELGIKTIRYSLRSS